MAKIYKQNCAYCQKYYEGQGRLYCSPYCRAKSLAKRGSDAYNWKGGLASAVCLYCSKPFQYAASGSSGRFCSHKCCGLYREKKRGNVCRVCKVKLDPDNTYKPSEKYSPMKICKECSRERVRIARKNMNPLKKKARNLRGSLLSKKKLNKDHYIWSVQELVSILDKGVTCPYCKKEVEMNKVSIDHITPLSRGGSGNRENLVFCCLECNLMKGNLEKEEFMSLLSFLEDKPAMYAILKTRLKGSGFMYRRR